MTWHSEQGLVLSYYKMSFVHLFSKATLCNLFGFSQLADMTSCWLLQSTIWGL